MAKMNVSLAWIAAFVSLGVSLFFGFHELFSTFRPWDDEGYWLMVSRLLVQGGTLYDTIFIPYGPVAVVFKDLIHGVLDIPITNTNARYLTLVLWLCTSALSAIFVGLLTSSKPLAFTSFLLVFYYLKVFANEPGHPQELIALFSSVMLAVVFLKGRLRWFLWGGIIALIFLAKANAGVYYGLAMGTIVLISITKGDGVRWIGWLGLSCSLALPFVVIGSDLFVMDGFGLALLFFSSISILMFFLWRRLDPEMVSGNVLYLLGGFFSCCLLFGLYLSQKNSSYPSMFESVFYFVQEVKSLAILRHYSYSSYVAIALSAILALQVLSPKGRFNQAGLCIARVIMVVVAAFAILNGNAAKNHWILAYGMPFVWVVLCSEASSGLLPRATLASLAIWSSLISYPVPGSQLFFGSVLLVITGIVCYNDLFEEVYIARDTRVNLTKAGAVALLVVALAGMFNLSIQTKKFYESLVPLDLPGTKHIRLSKHRVAGYQRMVDILNASDVAFISSGLNSFYFWSSTAMTAPVVTQFDLAFLRLSDRLKIKQGLEQAKSPVIFVKVVTFEEQNKNNTELLDWLISTYVIREQYRGFYILEPSG